ncbi:MAG: protein phosphatase 2C domain-containing protein [Candidatus Eisenbacteria bacterium]|uniref:Protein phosphatase 2C domain-containing protein n=1 Tax=Eiseniibacteriota bacterium TaxID=2212470 RepID=A0A956SEY8_UNCEI|nr:protein phosphatase 2C domain-containing protein [Candidatus Eisenbacteria bacterium]MCB9464572.1 protein phosphatase 2C domain-containing protein [Candidatus Eisenbacteria bacterium]
MSGTDRIYSTLDMDAPEFVSFAGYHAAIFTHRRPESPTANEDGAALIPYDDQSGVAVVADGLGGSSAGERASAMALEELQRSIAQARETGEPLRSAILTGIENANDSIQKLGIGAMTTLAVAEIDQESIRTYHVGDSEILVLGGRGKVKLRTVSHSPVGYGVEAGFIDAAEAMHHEDRHIVNNVVGEAEMRIEIGSPIPLAPRDTIVLASDGLIDNLHADEIAAFLCHGRFRYSVTQVASAAYQRMTSPQPEQPSKLDDLTMIVLRRAATLGKKSY